MGASDVVIVEEHLDVLVHYKESPHETQPSLYIVDTEHCDAK